MLRASQRLPARTVLGFLLLSSSGAAQPLPAPDEAAAQQEVLQVTLVGVTAPHEPGLRETLQTRESPWLPWKDKVYFNQTIFAADLARIPRFYEERGHPHARVVDSRVDGADGGVRVTIVVDEGAPVRTASVGFMGFDVLGAAGTRGLEERAPLQPGDILAASALTRTAQFAANALGEAGYAYARIETRQVMVAPDRVSVEFHAEPGSRVAFGPIQISGNTSIADAVIRRELAYLPGQPFRITPLQETEQRLSRLGFFRSISIEIVEPDRPQPEVPTRVTVQEADLNQFSYSIGYGSEEQLHGEAQWRLLNVFGGGRSGLLRARWSAIDRGGEGAFQQPYVFGPRFSLQLTGAAWQVSEPIYTLWSAGGSASLGYALGRLNRVTAAYLHQYERNQVREEFLVDAELEPLLEASSLNPAGEQDGLHSALRFDVLRDTTTEPQSPRAGYRARALFEKAGGWLPGAFTYLNFAAIGSYYRGVGPFTLAGRLQFGSLAAAREADVPFSKRYFLGGADTLRGWGRHEVSPLSPSGLPVGGRTLLAMNGEIRFPAFKRLSSVAFVDAGNVWANAWNVRPGDLRSDAGVGARVDTPFGLFRLDFGYQLTPIEGLRLDGTPQDRGWRVHLNLGHAF